MLDPGFRWWNGGSGSEDVEGFLYLSLVAARIVLVMMRLDLGAWLISIVAPVLGLPCGSCCRGNRIGLEIRGEDREER